MCLKLDNMGKITQEVTGGEIVISLKLISIFMKIVATGIMHGNVHVTGARVSLSNISTTVYIFLLLQSLHFHFS